MLIHLSSHDSLHFNTANRWYSECKSCFVVFIGDAEVRQSNDIHTDKQVIIVNIAAIDLYIMDEITTWQTNMNHVCLGSMVSSNAHYPALTVRL